MLVQEKLLNQAVSRYQKDPHVRAIFVGGSFARGDQHALSDIDLVLIVDKPRRYVRYYHKDIHIEVDALTLVELRKRLATDPASYYSYWGLKPLIDPHGLAKKVSKIVRDFEKSYRPTALTKGNLYFKLFNYHLKLRAAIRDHNTLKQAALLVSAQEKCFDALVELNNLPAMPPHRLIRSWSSLKKRPSNFKKLLEEMLLGTLPMRVNATKRLLEYLLPKLKPALQKFPQYYRSWEKK